MQSVAHNAYHYAKELPAKGWFRLLKVQPSTVASKPLVCRLEAQRMANSDPYEALSYTWGEENANVSVGINDNSFLVRENLHAALLALRRKDRERALWVDAICINQGKETERNHQVWQMRGIYANASRVKVWLGDATEGSNRGMDLLRTFAQISPTATGQHIRSVQDFVSFYRPFLSLGDSPETFASLEEALKLLRRQWWTRIWTLQESVLGQETDCICGTEEVPINGFTQFSAFVVLAVSFGMWRGPPVDSTIQLRNAKWLEICWGMLFARSHGWRSDQEG
ncbi:Putative heterokaryon incompatibility [Colletotrichum destructivum]|uniref:Heterokaryon incompatibility n=1 Tax=Colletotrichum destructivum TaxID=34406 RepID=A0AAX4I7U6_9PEZI|nr:Putative heterokaryon incompatibility [Colletotrichum destructivum]